MKFYPLIIILIFAGCSGSPGLVLDDSKSIIVTYSFHGASVSPDYQRNYEISVSETKVHVVVDSYGDVLQDENYPIDSDQFNALIHEINEANLVSGDHQPNEPCEGGTSESLTITEEVQEVYHGHFDGCAGDIPASSGKVDLVIDKVKNLVPDLSNLLN